jgi:hypothetical protein
MKSWKRFQWKVIGGRKVTTTGPLSMWGRQTGINRDRTGEITRGKKGYFSNSVDVLLDFHMTILIICNILQKKNYRPPTPKLVPYESLVEGFVEPLRTFELPGRMTLPNMVSVLTDIWEIEGVS